MGGLWIQLRRQESVGLARHVNGVFAGTSRLTGFAITLIHISLASVRMMMIGAINGVGIVKTILEKSIRHKERVGLVRTYAVDFDGTIVTG